MTSYCVRIHCSYVSLSVCIWMCWFDAKNCVYEIRDMQLTKYKFKCFIVFAIAFKPDGSSLMNQFCFVYSIKSNRFRFLLKLWDLNNFNLNVWWIGKCKIDFNQIISEICDGIILSVNFDLRTLFMYIVHCCYYSLFINQYVIYSSLSALKQNMKTNLKWITRE